jgi:hypothetical protein
MMCTPKLGLRAIVIALLAAMFLATAAPAEENSLALVPAGAPIVVQIHGVARTQERLFTMIKNSLPELAAQVQAKFNDRMNEELKGRKLQGLAPEGPDFIVVTALPEPSQKAPHMVAYLARVSNYTEFIDGLLKPQERKGLTTASQGYQVTTLESGEKFYLLRRQDYAIFTSQKEVADQFAKGQPPLKLSQELTTELLRPDIAVYVDVAVINTKYGETIKSGRQSAEQWFGPSSPWMKTQTKANVEILKAMIDSAFRAVADSTAAVAGVEFRPEGLALSAQDEVGANTQTNRYLKRFSLFSGKDLGSLPAGQMGYWTMRLSPEILEASPWVKQWMLGVPSQGKAVREAFNELVAANPRSVLEDFNLPPGGLKISHFQYPDKAAAAMLKFFEAFEASEAFQSTLIKGKPEVKPNSRVYRGFQLSSVSMKWDFDKMLASYKGPEQGKEAFKEAMERMMGEGVEVWFGTNGKINVTAAAQDWPSAQRQLDRYLDGKDTLGQQPPYLEARKEMPSTATVFALLDIVGYAHRVLEPFRQLSLKERGGGTAAAAPAMTPTSGKPSYVGVVVQLQPEHAGFELWVPEAAAQDLYKAYKPMLRK